MNPAQDTPSQIPIESSPAPITARAVEKSADAVERRFARLPDSQYAEWDEFVLNCERGSAFQTIWWYRAWGTEPVVQVLRNSQGEIEAGICYALGRRWGTSAMVRPPCTAGNGPVFLNAKGQGRYKEITHAKQMTLMAIHSLPRLGLYDMRLRPADQDLMPFLWNGFETHVGYTYVIPAAEKDSWMDGAAKSTRKELRRAAREVEEQGYRIEEGPDPAEMLPLIQDTVDFKQFRIERLRERFANWWNALRDHKVGRGYLLRDRDGRPMATDVLIYDRRRAYSVLGGIRADLRKDSRVGTILLDRMIRDAHQMGLDFDFEGSALPGVERFMRSFGGELQPMCRVIKIRSPLAWIMWQTYRYFTQHRRSWVWHD
jgi:hypothetical protein